MPESVSAKLDSRYHTLNELIIAREDWGDGYKRTPDILNKLIKQLSRFELALKKHFKDLAANRVDMFVNWAAYSMENIKADDRSDFINQIVVSLDSYDFTMEQDLLLQILQNYILAGVALGVSSAQATYVDAGLSATSEAVQKAALDKSAGLVKGISNTTREQIQQSVAISLRLHETIEDATSRLQDIIGDPYRAEMIANTEIRNSYVEGSNLVATETGAVQKEWSPSSDPCVLCEENVADGIIAIDDDFTNGDDPHPWCVLPNQEVEALNPTAKMTSPYDGLAVYITTSSGVNLAVTPKHKVATLNGWVEAGKLKSGYDLFNTNGNVQDMFSVVNPKSKTVKALVEDIRIPGPVIFRRMPAAPIYLNGDAAACEYIDIVLADSKLRDRDNVMFSNFFDKQKLNRRDIVRSKLVSLCSLHRNSFINLSTSPSLVSSLGIPFSLFGSETSISKRGGLAHSSQMDTFLLEDLGKRPSVTATFMRQFYDRFASIITLDKIAKVEIRHYKGLVYDLTTEYSFYTCNSIITHNCKCADPIYYYSLQN